MLHLFERKIIDEVDGLDQVLHWLVHIDSLLCRDFIIPHETQLARDLMRFHRGERPLLFQVQLISDQYLLRVGLKRCSNLVVPFLDGIKAASVLQVDSQHNSVCLLKHGLGEHVRHVGLVPELYLDCLR